MNERNVFEFDSVKPPKSVTDAWTNLEDLLLTQIRETPVEPADLLERIRLNAADQLLQVTVYLHSNGFLSDDAPNVPVLFHVLGINPLTGRGRRASLVKEGEKTLLNYFPGYTLETNLHTFLMQELPQPLIKIVKSRHGTPRTNRPRETLADAMLRSMYASCARLEPPFYPKFRQLTIGGFLDLPKSVIEAHQEVYSLLRNYGFTSEAGRV